MLSDLSEAASVVALTNVVWLTQLISSCAVTGLYVTCAIPTPLTHNPSVKGCNYEKHTYKKYLQIKTNYKLTASSMRSPSGHHIVDEALLLRSLQLEKTNTMHLATNSNHSLLSKLLSYLTDSHPAAPSWLPLVFCPNRIPVMHGDMNYPSCLRGKIRCQIHHKSYQHNTASATTPPVCTCLQSWTPNNQPHYPQSRYMHDHNDDEAYKSKCNNMYYATHPADTEKSPLSPITKNDKVTSKRDGKPMTDATNTPAADSIPHISPPDNSPQPPAHTVEAEAQQPSEHKMAEAKQANTKNSTTSHVQFIKNATNRSATIQTWHIKNSAFKFAMKILTPGKEQSPEKVNSNTPKTPEHTATCGNPTDQHTNKVQVPNANTTTPL